MGLRDTVIKRNKSLILMRFLYFSQKMGGCECTCHGMCTYSEIKKIPWITSSQIKYKLRFHTKQRGSLISAVAILCVSFTVHERLLSYNRFGSKKKKKKTLSQSVSSQLHDWLEDNLNAEQWQQESTPFSGEIDASKQHQQTWPAITLEGVLHWEHHYRLRVVC